MKQFTFDGSNSEGGKVIIKAIIARITESLSYQVWVSLGGLFYLSFYRVRLINCPYNGFNSVWLMEYLSYPVDTGLKLNVHKTFIRRPGRLLNVLCTFNLRPVTPGKGVIVVSKWTNPAKIIEWSTLVTMLWNASRCSFWKNVRSLWSVLAELRGQKQPTQVFYKRSCS